MTASAQSLPDAADPPSSTGRSRWFGWMFTLAVLIVAPVVLIVAAGVAVFLWWQIAEAKAAGEVQAEVARIQMQGEPITIYDLYQYHRVPAGTQDITADWLAVLRLYGGQMNNDGAPLPIVGTGKIESLAADAPDSSLAAAEAYLLKYDNVMQATLAVGRLPGECRMPTAFENGSAGIPPQMQEFRTVARHMHLRAMVSIARGDNDAAIESLETILATGRAMEHQLSLVEQLVRIAIVNVALFEIGDLVASANLTDEQLARLQADVWALNIQDSFTKSLIGERGMGYRNFHQLPSPPGMPVATAADPMAGLELVPGRVADCHFYLLMMQDLIDASRSSPPKTLQNAKAADARLAQAQQSDPLANMKYGASSQVLPAMRAAFDANARTHAVRNLMLAAIAVKRYRLKHGQYPQDLEALVPEFLSEVPSDPYDGQPLRMKTGDEGLILYSIGRDQRDDGGLDPQDRNEPDIVVRLAP